MQNKLRWDCDVALSDRICNYNRNWAEFAGYWMTTSFLKETDPSTGNSKSKYFLYKLTSYCNSDYILRFCDGKAAVPRSHWPLV